MNLDSLLNEFLASPAAQKLGAQLGLKPEQMADATRRALPVALAQLQKLRATQGDEAAAGAVSQVAIDPDLPDAPERAVAQPNARVDGLLGGHGDALGGLLGKLLGGGGEDAGGKGRQVLGSLVPLVLGFLQKKGLGATDAGGVLGGLASVLDQDKDGSALDEISAMILGDSPRAENPEPRKGGLRGLFGSLFGK